MIVWWQDISAAECNNMEDGQVTAEASADAGTVQDTYDISEEGMLCGAERSLPMREPGSELRLWNERRKKVARPGMGTDDGRCRDVENWGVSTTIANLDYAAEMN